jgi:hypothetical protein
MAPTYAISGVNDYTSKWNGNYTRGDWNCDGVPVYIHYYFYQHTYHDTYLHRATGFSGWEIDDSEQNARACKNVGWVSNSQCGGSPDNDECAGQWESHLDSKIWKHAPQIVVRGLISPPPNKTLETEELNAFKASGGTANDKALATWSGDDACNGQWTGVGCSSGQVPAVTQLDLNGYDHDELRSVTGDAKPLARLTELTLLHLGGTKVAVDTKDLAPLVNLQLLGLGGFIKNSEGAVTSKVTGDMKGVAALVQLTELDLRATKMVGDVEDLAPLVNLRTLRLTGVENVTVDVKGLAVLVQLTEIFLPGTKVVGDVKDLAPLVNLRTLDLASAENVTGDVKGLAALVQLTEIYLGGTKVVGDLQGLAPLVNLTDLFLENTKVTGDLHGLAPLVQLTGMSLELTKVTGDLQGLVSLVQLERLDLVYAEYVTGNVKALDPLLKLVDLHLFGTKVTGCGEYCKQHPIITQCNCPVIWPPAYTLLGVCARNSTYVQRLEGTYTRSETECNSAPMYNLSNQYGHFVLRVTPTQIWLFTAGPIGCSDDRGYIGSGGDDTSPSQIRDWSENDGGKDSKWYYCPEIKVNATVSPTPALVVQALLHFKV